MRQETSTERTQLILQREQRRNGAVCGSKATPPCGSNSSTSHQDARDTRSHRHSGQPLHLADQLVSKPLMIARAMIMVEISAHRLTKGFLVKEDQSRKALRFDAQVKSFKMGIQIRTLCWQSHRLYIGIFQDRSECRAEVVNRDPSGHTSFRARNRRMDR